MATTERSARPYQAVEDGVTPPWVGERMTLEEFLALPEVKPYLEYEDGVVRQKVAPKFVHSSAQGFFYTAFNQIARPRRLGAAYTELRFVTPGWATVPDVAFYRHG